MPKENVEDQKVTEKVLESSTRKGDCMVVGRVNETLNKQMAFKGADGLSESERRAYEICRQLSCAHEACYKRYMYAQPAKQQKECGPLMDKWKACFADEIARSARTAS